MTQEIVQPVHVLARPVHRLTGAAVEAGDAEVAEAGADRLPVRDHRPVLDLGVRPEDVAGVEETVAPQEWADAAEQRVTGEDREVVAGQLGILGKVGGHVHGGRRVSVGPVEVDPGLQ